MSRIVDSEAGGGHQQSGRLTVEDNELNSSLEFSRCDEADGSFDLGHESGHRARTLDCEKPQFHLGMFLEAALSRLCSGEQRRMPQLDCECVWPHHC